MYPSVTIPDLALRFSQATRGPPSSTAPGWEVSRVHGALLDQAHTLPSRQQHTHEASTGEVPWASLQQHLPHRHTPGFLVPPCATVIPNVPFSTRASLAGHGKMALVTEIPAALVPLSRCPQAAAGSGGGTGSFQVLRKCWL